MSLTWAPWAWEERRMINIIVSMKIDSIDQHKLWNGDAHLFFFFTCNDDNVFLIIIYPDFTCMYPVILFYLHKSMK